MAGAVVKGYPPVTTRPRARLRGKGRVAGQIQVGLHLYLHIQGTSAQSTGQAQGISSVVWSCLRIFVALTSHKGAQVTPAAFLT
jgi:hypothetical protein